VERMLAKDPAKRPETMAEVRAGLGLPGVSRDVPWEPTAPRRVRWTRRWAARAAAAALVIAGARALALWPVHRRGGALRGAAPPRGRPARALDRRPPVRDPVAGRDAGLHGRWPDGGPAPRPGQDRRAQGGLAHLGDVLPDRGEAPAADRRGARGRRCPRRLGP